MLDDCLVNKRKEFEEVVDEYASEKLFDASKIIESSIKDLLGALQIAYGLDTSNENFRETPERVARMFLNERFCGINSEEYCKSLLMKSFPKHEKDSRDEMIIAANPAIAWSVCPHHLENVEYKVWMGYMPKDDVVGISKFNRVICHYAKQPILQEDYTSGLARLFEEALDPLGSIVIVKGKHDCMIARGARANPDQWVVTSAVRGLFLTEETYKQEFLNLCKL